MEHPCHRCGSPVEDSSAFCPGCGAPQVRFARAKVRGEAVVVPQGATRVPISMEPATAPPHPAEMPGRSEATIRNRNSAWRSAATAGLVGALLSILPFGFLLAFPLAGFLSVLFYRRRTWGVELSPSAGLRLGLLTGVLGFAMSAVWAAVNFAVSPVGAKIRQSVIEELHRQQARAPDPQARQIIDYFLTPNGMAVMFLASLIILGIGLVLLAGLGGAFSASLLRRKGPEN